MDNNKFWVLCNLIIGVIIIAVTFIALSYWKDHNAKIVKMIAGGVNPIAAMCAMQDDYGKMPVCLVLATQNKTK